MSKIHDACGRGHKFHHVILALNKLETLRKNEQKEKNNKNE